MTNPKYPIIILSIFIFITLIVIYYFLQNNTPTQSNDPLLSSPEPISKEVLTQKIQTYQSEQTKYQAKINDLFTQAEKLSKKAWTTLPAEEANPPFNISYNSNKQLEINDSLKDYFSYYLKALSNSTPLVECISRFLDSTQNLPEPAKTQAIHLFKKFILVESNLNERIGEGLPKTKQLINQLQSIPSNQTQARDNILHQLQLHAQTIQQNKEITMLAVGGKDIQRLYKNTNDRANLELQVSLINTDTKLTPNEKIPKIMETMGVTTQQPLDVNGGAARMAYSTIDASVLSQSKLSDSEKDQLRLTYFGQAYLDEYNKIYR